MRNLLGVLVVAGLTVGGGTAAVGQDIPPPPLPVPPPAEAPPAEVPLPDPPFTEQLLPPLPEAPSGPEAELIPMVPPPTDVVPPAAETSLPGKLRVAIVQPSVSLDGVGRPELARAVADALVSDFLKNGSVEVIDVGNRPVEELTRGAGQTPVCDVAFVPTVVGHRGEYHMTVRRILLPSGKIEQLYEDRTTGSLPGLMEMTARLARQLVPPPPPEPPPPPSPPPPRMRTRIWMDAPPPPPPTRSSTPAAQSRPRAARPASASSSSASRPSHTTQVEANPSLELETVGRLVSFHPEYSFCVIRPTPGRRRLTAGTHVFIRVEGVSRPTVRAIVRNSEGGQVIADYVAKDNPPLVPGAQVYGWVPATSTSSSPGLTPVPASAAR